MVVIVKDECTYEDLVTACLVEAGLVERFGGAVWCTGCMGRFGGPAWCAGLVAGCLCRLYITVW